MATIARQPAIVGVYNTKQSRRLEGETERSLILEAVQGALADAGLTLDDVDGVSAGMNNANHLIYDLRLGPSWVGTQFGLNMVLEAAGAISIGSANVVVLASAGVNVYTDHGSTAPWTKPENEWVAPWGLFTAAEFALIARRHMKMYGTTPEQLATVAATIRNNGNVNPDAVYFGRGPFKPQDVLDSRMVADPFHLLDCSMTAEGGCAIVVAAADRVSGTRKRPVYVLGGGVDYFGPAYCYPPAWDLVGRAGDVNNGLVGRRAAQRAFAQAGLGPDDVDTLEFYDPFSFEIIRQLEAFGFCPEGEGGPFVEDGHIALTGSHPVTTDGGTMSYSHAGANPQMMQRVIRSVQQLRGECGNLQVPGAEVSIASNAGAGALFNAVALFGVEPS